MLEIVIVSQDASFKLDNSMFVVDGSYESGYVYDEDVFIDVCMIESINENDWCFVGDNCPYTYDPNHTIATIGQYCVHTYYYADDVENMHWHYNIHDLDGDVFICSYCSPHKYNADVFVDIYIEEELCKVC